MASRRALGLVAAFVLALAAGPGGSPPALAAVEQPALLEIDGNVVLVDEVYLAVIDLPAGARATRATAAEVARQILRFLRRAGYSLARVKARVEGDRIHVTIDEGRLSRIIVKGRDVISSLAVSLQLDLPFDVLNKPQLERLLGRFVSGDVKVRYTLVPVPTVDDQQWQIDPLSLLPGAAPAPPPASHELHIVFSGRGRPRGGLTFDADVSPDSMRASGELTGYSRFFDGDRWELEAELGTNYLENLRTGNSQLEFSLALLDASWLSPTILRGVVRGVLRVRDELVQRQRRDLRVDRYWWNRLEAAGGVALEPRRGFSLRGELGLQRRDLFSISQLPEATMDVSSRSAVIAFAALSLRLDFDPDALRIDRRHRLVLEGREALGAGRAPFWLLEAGYRRVIEFGWNDLWLRANAAGVGGEYEIADAIPMHHLRGVFGGQFYLDRVASVAVDYRISLQRDLFKVGVFHEAAVFREAAGSPTARRSRAGNSFGPSFHALVLDVIQLDLSYAFGFLDDGSFDYGVSINLQKAY
jgi:hypothetical protein